MKYSPLSPKFKNRVATSTGSDVRTPHGGEMGRGNKNEKALQEKASFHGFQAMEGWNAGRR
jgi:hypothetical protein